MCDGLHPSIVIINKQNTPLLWHGQKEHHVVYLDPVIVDPYMEFVMDRAN